MTYERFKEIWDSFGFRFECSPELSDALIAASNGDFRAFDEIDEQLFLRHTPDETSNYFKKRFAEIA